MSSKNVFLNQVLNSKKESYKNGFWDGMNIMLNLVAIALNHNKKRRFGKKMLGELESDVQALVDEMIDVNDPLVNAVHIEREVRRIRGKEWDDE